MVLNVWRYYRENGVQFRIPHSQSTD